MKVYHTQNRDLMARLKLAVDKYTNLRFNRKNTNEYEIASHRRKLINPLILYSDRCYIKEKRDQSGVTLKFKLSFTRLKLFLSFFVGALSLFFFFLSQRLESLVYFLVVIPFYFLLKRKTEGLFYDLLKKLDLAHPI